ncbi:MAG TPA: hypothetical protein DCF33_14190 [Saprospirales bacterium]|nr:hypothetical protein [Saprospirales bacterium]
MKLISILLLHFILFVQYANAQKQDNVWLFGYRFDEDSLSNGIIFQFDDSLKITYEPRPMDFATTSACISDSSGNLLLYSNGCYIANSADMEVEGSSGLNPGILYNLFCADDVGYNIPTGMISLPDPGESTMIHFFHYPSVTTAFKNLLHTQVDISSNNGLAQVLFKNQPIILDTIHPDGMHSVKHANGRDWWIITAKQYSNRYYTLLLSPDGIFQQEQSIGTLAMSGAGGQMVFSPDGSKIARFNAKDDLRIFDFDRCTGTLSNPIFIPIQDNADNENFAGLAWSADGHYLYAAEIKRILQFDMWASDIAASMTIVAERPPSPSPNLGYLELGPDGYIYGRPLGGDWRFHRIKHPERGGFDSEVQQSYYFLDFPHGNLPHFPNFRLGPVDGSACDTLGLDNHPLAGWRYDKTEGLSVDFTSVSWYEPDTWWWDFGDGAQSNERNPTHTFPAPGAYEVCLSVSNEYGTDTKCKWVWLNTSGIKPLSSGEGLGVRLFPNPSTGQIFWMGLEGEAVTLQVFNALGQQVAERNSTENGVDLSHLPSGVYHIKFLTSDNTIRLNKSVVIEK